MAQLLQIVPWQHNDLPVTRIWGSSWDVVREITSVTIPATITRIEGNAFRNTIYLETVVFEPDSQLVSIGPAAFLDSGIKTILIPSTVTTIWQGAFGGAINIESIIIPSSVTSVLASAFYGWTIDQRIYVPFTTQGNRPAGWNVDWSGGDALIVFQD